MSKEIMKNLSENPIDILILMYEEIGFDYDKDYMLYLRNYCNELLENTKDLDVDVAQIISNDFWEMYDRF